MKILIFAVAALIVLSSLPGFADEVPVNEAYSLYYSGQQDEAIRMMEDYIIDHPDPAAYYFLGYAYYEMKDMEKASEYFDEAFRLKSFYSPGTSEESQ